MYFQRGTVGSPEKGELAGSMDRIYRWNGRYFGFIRNDRFFAADSTYIGWMDDDGRVWESDGNFLGEIVNDDYILRRTSMATPARRAVKARPAKPATPSRPANRAGKVGRAGSVDALDKFPDR